MKNQKRALHQETITLSKEEYLHLSHQAQAYQVLATRVFELPLLDPISDVVTDFKKTNQYSSAFLKDLEDGLRKSSYAKRYAHKNSQKRH